MLSQALAVDTLRNMGIDFTITAFRRSISSRDADTIFYLFIQAGIFEKLKNHNSIILYTIRNGSLEKVRAVFNGLALRELSPEHFFELTDRAAFEQYDTPDSASASQWKASLFGFIDQVRDVNFIKVQSFRSHNHLAAEEQSPLRLAVFIKSPELVQSLIEKHASVNHRFTKDSYLQGGNLLHLLSSQNKTTTADLTIAEILIKAGIAIDLRDTNNHTPLARCAMNGLTDLADILIRQGAQIDEKVGSRGDSTILMYSIIHKNYDITKLLLDSGADIHYKDKNGWTAAKLAFGRRNKEIGEALVSRGAILRPFIGLSGSTYTGGGILVEILDNTVSGSAYAAGIRIHDILIGADFQPVNSIQELIEVIARKRPLDTMIATILRNNTVLEFVVEIQVI